MPAPENKKGSQSFLELSNYMKRFIHDYIVHKHIIYENYCRRIKITYGQKHMSWFLTILNNHLVVKVLLPILTTMERFIYTNASTHGISAILLQKSRNQANCKIVTYSSRALTSTEKNYSQLKRKCLAIVYGCEKNPFISFRQTFYNLQ